MPTFSRFRNALEDFRYPKAMPRPGSHRRIDSLGFRAWIGSVKTMPSAHTHSDLELNYCLRGSMTYLWQDRLVTVKEQHVVAFWGACVHQVVEADADTRVAWVTLPLEEVVRLPGLEKLTTLWLEGAMVHARAADPLDDARFTLWAADHVAGDSRLTAAARAEIEARLIRLACEPHPRPQKQSRNGTTRRPAATSQLPATVLAMAAYVASRFDEPIQTADVAKHVSLHPNYAMALFKQHVGTTITDYLMRQRLCHAQRLLMTTDLPVLEVGLAGGFGSTSRFYEAFKKQTGESPAAYRQKRRLGPTGS